MTFGIMSEALREWGQIQRGRGLRLLPGCSLVLQLGNLGSQPPNLLEVFDVHWCLGTPHWLQHAQGVAQLFQTLHGVLQSLFSNKVGLNLLDPGAGSLNENKENNTLRESKR